MKRLLLSILLTGLPGAAAACGGLFCNSAQPVNQSAESILFVTQGERMHMHVRLSYQGPPADFGWLLPAPADVETSLSSQAVFDRLESHRPQFRLNVEFAPSCQTRGGLDAGAVAFAEADAATSDSGVDQPSGVNVLSREAVGPYDRAILDAESVEDLRRWLDDNAFQVPAGSDDALVPYVENGSVFVAIKLLADAQSSDVVPLQLSFAKTATAVPIVPTQVAATPDMGIAVHILGDFRAIPTNYLHVEINEAAINWRSGGSNYVDVVSQAVDEAGGRGWVTDYSGEPTAMPAPFNQRQLDALAAANSPQRLVSLDRNIITDTDVLRIVGSLLTLPPEVPLRQFLNCPDCYEPQYAEQVVDGAALLARVEAEIQPVRTQLQTAFADHRWMTRLFTTMSPEEMTLDPLFAQNPDLPTVSNLHTATEYIHCNDRGQHSTLQLNDGRVFDFDRPLVARQDGETVRGAEVEAAQLIAQLAVTGQPMVVHERDISHELPSDADDAGCACDVPGGSGGGGGALAGALLLLWGIRRRSIATSRRPARGGRRR